MTGKQLRNSILQWAIQGKLVSQDPNDEPTSVLLQRIREEKSHLVKDGKIKRDKNETIIYRGDDNSYYEKTLATGAVRCIDDEIPFEIPNSWEWCRMSSLVQINPKVEGPDDAQVAFVPMEAITAGYGSEFRFYERKWREIKSGYTTFADNDIAFAKITPCFQNRKSVIFRNLPNGIGAGTTELKVLRVYGETMNRWYLLYFLEAPYFIDEATFKGTANQQRIIIGYLENKLVPVPPYNEQSNIVKRIGALMPVIDKYSDSNEILNKLNKRLNENLRKSILQEAIQGRLVPQIESEGTADELLAEIRTEKERLVKEGKLKKSVLASESRIFRADDNKYYEQIGTATVDITNELPFDIPLHWRWCRLGCCADLQIGKTPARGETAYWSNGEYPWVSISDIFDGEVLTRTKEKISEHAATKVFKGRYSTKGSLIMSFKLTIGKIAILGIDAYHNEAIITIHPYNPTHIILEYFKYILPIFAQMGDSKDAIKGKTLNSSSLMNLLIPLPPIAEQQRITGRIIELSKFLK